MAWLGHVVGSASFTSIVCHLLSLARPSGANPCPLASLLTQERDAREEGGRECEARRAEAERRRLERERQAQRVYLSADAAATIEDSLRGAGMVEGGVAAGGAVGAGAMVEGLGPLVKRLR